MVSPLIVDILGVELKEEEKELLAHPLIGGVILFTRNFQDKAQLIELVRQIKAIKRPKPLLVTVDQEGGRVQRFKTGFTLLPSAKVIGQAYEQDQQEGLALAQATGLVMASELTACGIDLSFAPVLDIDYGKSEVIGTRSFHQDPQIVAVLAKQYILGMQRAGMACVGKHFPGHGAVLADSHFELPEDTRGLAPILAQDCLPYRYLISENILSGIMPAHIRYTQVDEQPTGFSKKWLQDILRKQLQFNGAIISDDLIMAGAGIYPDIVMRVDTAIKAGCDYVLICNDQASVFKVVDRYTMQSVDHSFHEIPAQAGHAINPAMYKEAREMIQSLNNVTCDY